MHRSHRMGAGGIAPSIVRYRALQLGMGVLGRHTQLNASSTSCNATGRTPRFHHQSSHMRPTSRWATLTAAALVVAVLYPLGGRLRDELQANRPGRAFAVVHSNQVAKRTDIIAVSVGGMKGGSGVGGQAGGRDSEVSGLRGDRGASLLAKNVNFSPRRVDRSFSPSLSR